MKKFFYGILCFVLTAGISSCNDSDPVFGLVGGVGYGLQFTDSSFIPVMYFQVGNGYLDGTASKVMHGEDKLRTSLFNEVTIEVKEEYSNLKDMSGDYICTAVSKEGEQDVNGIRLNFDKPLRELSFEYFEYTGTELKMTVTKQVENATSYSFYLRPYVNDSPTTSWIQCELFKGQDASTSDGQKIAVQLNTSGWADGTTVAVYPVAINGTSSRTTLVRLGEAKILRKGQSSFDE